MATPKPGEIRCPTCHRSTPPAAFCTQCGSAIPSDARIRPRGMDRDELQDRIRQRRSGGDPYRRGGVADADTGGYERFQPEPEDANARRARRPEDLRRDEFRERPVAVPPPVAPAQPADPRSETLVPPIDARPDITRESDDWARPVTAAATAPPPSTVVPPPSDVPVTVRYEDAEHLDNFDDAAYEDDVYPSAYDWDEGRRGSGGGAAAIIGFLALGVLALLGGAFLAGVFGDDPGTGGVAASASPSPTVVESVAPSASAPSEAPSVPPTGAASPSPAESGEPVVFPDGFTAIAEPCLPGSAGGSGCSSNGASNGGVVDIWVGFENGSASDVIGAAVVGPDGTTVGEGTIDLARIGCAQSCNGWTYFPFRNLPAGEYEVRITRNGDRASETTFEVS